MPYKRAEDRRAHSRRTWANLKADPEKYAAHQASAAEYRRQYQREHPEVHRAGNRRHAQKRMAWLSAIKVASGCVDCGYSKAPEALHFDHVDPTTKVMEIGEMKSHSEMRVREELAKCVVRCANCHAIRSAQQQRRWAINRGVYE